jgi:hypothetical protein
LSSDDKTYSVERAAQLLTQAEMLHVSRKGASSTALVALDQDSISKDQLFSAAEKNGCKDELAEILKVEDFDALSNLENEFGVMYTRERFFKEQRGKYQSVRRNCQRFGSSIVPGAKVSVRENWFFQRYKVKESRLGRIIKLHKESYNPLVKLISNSSNFARLSIVTFYDHPNIIKRNLLQFEITESPEPIFEDEKKIPTVRVPLKVSIYEPELLIPYQELVLPRLKELYTALNLQADISVIPKYDISKLIEAKFG